MPIITGTDAGEQVWATTGDDDIYALGGDDIIVGRGGHDTADGGSGSDTVSFVSTGTPITVTSNGGRVVIAEGSVQSIASLNVEKFSIVAGGLGLTVDASQIHVPILFVLHDYYANTIVGSTGDNVFQRTQGLSGFAHTLTGGGGSDRYEFYTNLDSMNGVTILDFDVDDTIHLLPMIAAHYVGLAPLAGLGDYRSYTAGGQTFVVADGGTTVLTIANGAFALEETAPGSNVLRIARQSLTEGDDDFDGGPLGSAIFAVGGNDTVDGGGGNDWVDGGEGDDQLVVSAGHDTVDGGNGADRLVLDWRDSINGIYSNAWIALTSAGKAGVIRDGSGRSASFDNIEFVELTTGSGGDHLTVGAGTVRTGAGADSVTGIGGSLRFEAGTGDDQFWSGDLADVYDAGEGFDEISYAFAPGGVTVTLGRHAGDVGTSSDGDQLSQVERVVGSAYGDILHGSDDADQLVGDVGDDTLRANDGHDFLSGGDGNDELHGGDGNDLLFPLDGTDAVYGDDGDDQIFTRYVSSGDSFDGGTGSDFLMFSSSASLASGSTEIIGLFSVNLASIERLALDSRPDAGMHVMMALEQFEEAGLIELSGGGGRDALTLAASGSPGANVTAAMPEFTLINWASSPTPHIRSSVLDYVALSGTIFVGQPSPNYTLYAREGLGVLQTLTGATGNDTLVGSSGEEYLFAFGGGADQLQAGGGNDVLVASNSNFLGTVSTATWAGGTFDGGSGNDIFSVGGVVDFAGHLTGIEHIYLQPAVTTTLPDGSGTQAAAELAIGAGEMAGLAGNLILSGTGAITVNLAPGESYDASNYSIASGASITHLVNGSTSDDTVLGLQTGDSIGGGNGNDVLNGNGGRDGLRGEEGQDWLQGGADNDSEAGGNGHDSVWGGAGDDLLEGGEGDDTLIGGDGIDTVIYFAAAAGVTVDLGWIENQNTYGAGWDTLFGIENLYGSTFDDWLTGNGFANVLRGSAGSDRLTGSGGNDSFVYAALSDSTAAAADFLTDFEKDKDRIDLSLIDANSVTAGDQAFHLGATPGRTGDLVMAYDAGSNTTSLSLYVNGDAAVDALIRLSGNHLGLGAADFVL